MAKVLNLFKRSAEVVLIWSPKRHIQDLKIKAILKLFHSKHSKQENELNNIETSDLLMVEVIYFDKTSNKIELIRSSIDACDEDNEIDENSIKTGRYRTITPDHMTFHDYMLNHNDLRNPSLVKFYPFTSLINHGQIIKSIHHCMEKEVNLPNNKDKLIKSNSDRLSGDKILDHHHSRSSSTIPSTSSRHSLTSTKIQERTEHKNKDKTDSSCHKCSKKSKKKSNKKHVKKSKKKHKHHRDSPSESSTTRDSRKRRKNKHKDKIDDKILQLLKFT